MNRIRSSLPPGFALGIALLVACAEPDSGAPPANAAAQAAAPAAVRTASTSPSTPAAGEPSLEDVRRATDRFRDVAIAEAEGYVLEMADCVSSEMMGLPPEVGAMGLHYVRPDLLGITGPPNPRVNGTGTHTDFLRPSILIYEPREDGSLELVALENLTFVEAWEAAGNTAPPSFHGVPYDRMQDDPATELDEAHMFEPHYDRHVWLYRDNPNGVFAPFNPNVTCSHYTPTASHGH